MYDFNENKSIRKQNNREGSFSLSFGYWKLTLILLGCAVLIVWSLLVVATFSSFKVSGGSMESAILSGDYILVNKWLCGGRIFDVWKSAEGEEVEVIRLLGTRKIKRNDVVVFNDPYFRSRVLKPLNN